MTFNFKKTATSIFELGSWSRRNTFGSQTINALSPGALFPTIKGRQNRKVELLSNFVVDGRTDGWNDGWTDRPTFRDARTYKGAEQQLDRIFFMRNSLKSTFVH